MNSLRTHSFTLQRQRGAIFIVMMVIMVLGTAAFLTSSLNSASTQIARDQATADALAQAKEALIGYAVKVQISSSNSPNQPRPGELPCPDNHTPGSASEGTPSTPCSGNAIGRLPWKTLGLPDLRDGSGERLWYAVSTGFKNSPRSGTLNSDTVGSITIRDTSGNIVNNGCSTYGLPYCPNPGASDAPFGTGAVAVIIAPGEVLTRQGFGTAQDRSDTGVNTDSNYLDIVTVAGITYDNANFIDKSSTNGFIQGRIKDNNGNIVVNDQLLVVTQDNIMQVAQKRVAGEVQNCLKEYAFNNNGRYPWATPRTDLGSTYNDKNHEFFGRIPDDLEDTKTGSSDVMGDAWGPNCNTHNINTPATWWLNWREMVFYGLADKYRPSGSAAPPFPSACASPGDCLAINNASIPARFVVIVAGKALVNPDQTNRNANRTNPFYYLEGGNENADQSGGYTFIQSAPSATFNDTLVYQ